ncbi:hypothetical protein [Thalassorhabdomicrobium marinisediminis]|uniref:hypothetical protein n=1 Tax=Thalassorhabdomicrobium marinisediminis TaxID=2170577 RepID=UPI002490E615|nr:hypothetical protein [Thalassorhabdomicrobium marinisediminis]
MTSPRRSKKLARAAILLSIAIGQPVFADGLSVGVSVGRTEVGVSVGGQSTASASVARAQRSVTANVDGSVRRNSTGARNVIDSHTSAGAGRSGVSAATCFRMFGTCPDQQAAQAGNAGAAAGLGVSSGQVANVRAGADGSVQRGPIFQSADFVGLVLMSADRQVLGIVQAAEVQADGTVLVTVQISATINAPLGTTRLRIQPTSRPDRMITFGWTAQQFVNSLS